MSSNVAAMACGTHESARIASRRAPRRRGLEDTGNNAGRGATRPQEITFFDPQILSHCSLWTTNEPKAPRTTACRSCWLASALHAASSRRGRPVPSQLERIHLDHTPYAGAIATAQTPSTLPQRCGSPHTPKPVCCLSDHKESTDSLGAINAQTRWAANPTAAPSRRSIR